jgi:hypothetical protein
MSVSILASEWFVELCEQQQELLTGSANPQINDSNFAQRLANTTGGNTTGPQGNVSKTNTDFADVNSGSKSILGSDNITSFPVEVFNNAVPTTPIVNSPMGML